MANLDNTTIFGDLKVRGNLTSNGLLDLRLANSGVSSYHQLNRNAISTENMFLWRTNNQDKWYLGQRNKNGEDGFSLFCANQNVDAMYFSAIGNVTFRNDVSAQYYYGNGIGLTGTAASLTAGRANRANGNFYIDDNYGNSIVGVYRSDRYQGVYSMGDSYKLLADGSGPGSLYGLAWTHSNVGGQSIGPLGHQLLVMENGITTASIGNGIWTKANITALGSILAPNFYGNITSTADFGIVSNSSGTSLTWRGRVGTTNAAADRATFIGTYAGNSVVAAHNNALNAWADLYINTVNATDGGNVYFPKTSINNAGTITTAGDVIAYSSSDIRLKDNIKPILNPLDKINKIGGYTFDWNDKQSTYTGHDVGVIAQEIEEVLPELVTTRENGYKAVKYEKIIALLIEGIKEQQLQIDELKLIINKFK